MRTTLPNGAAYDRASKGPSFTLFSSEHCCVCGKGISDLPNACWLLLIRATDGKEEYAISSPKDATVDELKGSIWVAPIGPDCLRKHPELHHALICQLIDS